MQIFLSLLVTIISLYVITVFFINMIYEMKNDKWCMPKRKLPRVLWGKHKESIVRVLVITMNDEVLLTYYDRKNNCFGVDNIRLWKYINYPGGKKKSEKYKYVEHPNG